METIPKLKIFFEKNWRHFFIAALVADDDVADGTRVYIDPEIGYSGKARRFRRLPANDEQAVVRHRIEKKLCF